MQIEAFRLRHVAQCILQEAGDVSPLDEALSRVGLRQKDIAEGQTIDALVEPRFIDAACDVMEDHSFAARAGLSLKDATNLTAYIAKHSQNLRKAILNSARYYSVFDGAFSYDLKTTGNSATFEVDCLNPDFEHFFRHKEFLLFSFVARARTLTQSAFYPIEMRFDHEVRIDVDKIVRMAGCPVVFGTESLEVLLPISALDLPVPTFDPNLRNHLMAYGDRLKREQRFQEPDLKSRIKGLVVHSLPGSIINAEEAASRLGMSPRTFARRLKEQGTTFRIIVDEVRQELAETYLKDSFSIGEIAFALDYADQAAFSSAFKRWAGCSPRAFREYHAKQRY